MGSICGLGRKDCFPALQLETCCSAIIPAINALWDVQNEDPDSICTYLVRGKMNRSILGPKSSMKKICLFTISYFLNPLLSNKTTVSHTLKKSPKLKKSPTKQNQNQPTYQKHLPRNLHHDCWSL